MREGERVWQCVTYTNDMTQRPHVCLSTPLNFPHIHGFFPPYPLHCTATLLNWLFVQHFKTCKDKSESNKDLTPGTLTFLQYLTKHRTLKLKTSQLQNQFILKDEDKISSELSNSGLYSIFELHNIFRSCWRSYELWVSHCHMFTIAELTHSSTDISYDLEENDILIHDQIQNHLNPTEQTKCISFTFIAQRVNTVACNKC